MERGLNCPATQEAVVKCLEFCEVMCYQHKLKKYLHYCDAFLRIPIASLVIVNQSEQYKCLEDDTSTTKYIYVRCCNKPRELNPDIRAIGLAIQGWDTILLLNCPPSSQ